MSLSQADGYADGLACEHQYLVGPPCGDEATMLHRGIARCAPHFEQFVLSHVSKYQLDLRAEARYIDTFVTGRDLGDENNGGTDVR